MLETVIAPHYPKEGPQGGRRAFPIAVMLRIYCLQQWYNLSDPGAEEALYDIQSMRAFCNLELGRCISPAGNLRPPDDTRPSGPAPRCELAALTRKNVRLSRKRSVASTIVPPRSNAPRASRYSATASNTVFVSSCASSRCRKFKIVVSSGIGSMCFVS